MSHIEMKNAEQHHSVFQTTRGQRITSVFRQQYKRLEGIKQQLPEKYSGVRGTRVPKGVIHLPKMENRLDCLDDVKERMMIWEENVAYVYVHPI